MNKIIYKTSLVLLLLFGSTNAFSQTKVAIYNANTQLENKVFATSLVNSFTHREFNFEAKDETSVINYFLSNQGHNTESGNVTNEVIMLVADKLRVDYVINFILYSNKSENNVKASLINVKNFSVDKTVTLTCKNLKNSADVKETTDEIAAQFLLGTLLMEKKMKEEKALAEQQAKREKAMADSIAKVEKKLAPQREKEEKAKTDSIAKAEKQKAIEEKLLAEQKAKREKAVADSVAKAKSEKKIEPVNPNLNLSFSEFKAQLRTDRKEMRFEKKPIPNILAANQFALSAYKKHRAEKAAGWTLFSLGVAMGAAGGGLWGDGTSWINFYYRSYCQDYYDYYEYNYQCRYYYDNFVVPGIIITSVGGAVFITGVGLLIAQSCHLKTSYHFYTKGGKTACTFNVTPFFSPNYQGVGLSLKF